MQYSEKEYLDARHGVDPGLREGEDLTSYNNEIITNHNQELIESYPWLSDNIVWNEDETFSIDYEKEDFTWTWLDAMDDGWRLAFGLDLCYDLKNALKEYDYNNRYCITEIKEKFGELRWYCGNVPDEKIYDIIDKYVKLSQNTCIYCGKPATMRLTDYIIPVCNDCLEELNKDYPHEFVEITDENN